MANTSGHVHAGEKAGSSQSCHMWRDKHVEGEASLFGAEVKRDVDKKQHSDDCACMCTRVELHVTGS